jgi:hypothetical protein
LQTAILGTAFPKKQFYFYYSFVGEGTVFQVFPSPHEFVALADMFRNEGPINFNTTGNYFVSAAEQVGEQEANP